MKDWEGDKAWADGFIPDVKSILGQYLIGEATREDDQERNTDLIVLRMDAIRIGVRIRRPHWATDPFLAEFTIRALRPKSEGGKRPKTELAKIIESWGRYLFYGFGDHDGHTLTHWTLGDLNAFRLWHSRSLCRLLPKEAPGILLKNKDNSSDFRAYRWSEIPGFIVGQSDSLKSANSFLAIVA